MVKKKKKRPFREWERSFPHGESGRRMIFIFRARKKKNCVATFAALFRVECDPTQSVKPKSWRIKTERHEPIFRFVNSGIPLDDLRLCRDWWISLNRKKLAPIPTRTPVRVSDRSFVLAIRTAASVQWQNLETWLRLWNCGPIQWAEIRTFVFLSLREKSGRSNGKFHSIMLDRISRIRPWGG